MSGGRKTELVLPHDAVRTASAFATEQGERWDRACLRPGELWGEDLFLQDALSPQLMGFVSLCIGHISRNESDPRKVQTQDQGNGTGEILGLGVGTGSKAAQPHVLHSPAVARVPQQPENCRGLGFPLC